MKTVPTVIITLVVLFGGVFLYLYLGGYDIAASRPHHGMTLRVLDMTMEKSVARRARGITPPDLSSPELVKFGSHHFQEMCVECHGGPGVARSEAGEDLYPKGPDLAASASRWTPEQLYWITRNGIKMTGMPAWGLTTDDHELWALVAFMKQLPSITPDQYREMVGAQASQEPGEHHPHE